MTATVSSPRADALLARLDQLRAERAEAQVELIGDASGDAADRATNVDANVRFALLEQRIETLELELASARVERTHDGQVTVGDLVTLDLGDGPEVFLIGSLDEAGADVEVLTPTSPLGRAAIGASVGDTVTYAPRAGRTMSAQVLEIR